MNKYLAVNKEKMRKVQEEKEQLEISKRNVNDALEKFGVHLSEMLDALKELNKPFIIKGFETEEFKSLLLMEDIYIEFNHEDNRATIAIFGGYEDESISILVDEYDSINETINNENIVFAKKIKDINFNDLDDTMIQVYKRLLDVLI
ncbi:hypothetical protein CA207_11350 [Macrococcoides caseolyticum]|uniref:hypothetical protein n=1 Tax=Macrococcoides caseolyticum TaxID=69966 RepID=UPI000A291001|nr:hypothetical protein [Macrococcus caseolyticus]ARQ04386.1 hypothetical protein CA207_11350 [Macrococcus caseolyticus]